MSDQGRPSHAKGRLAFYAVMTLLVASYVYAFTIPHAESVPSFVSIGAGKLLRSNPATQGWVTWSSTLYFTGFSKFATGDILDFSNVKLGPGGYVMPRLGFCSDTGGSTMTVTGITVNTVSYTNGAAGTQRVWCPDRGEPREINGESSSSWDAGNQVVTVNTSGAGAVTLSWYSSTSYGFTDAARIITTVFPLLIVLMVFGAIKNPEYRALLIQLSLVAGLLVLIANIIYAGGL